MEHKEFFTTDNKSGWKTREGLLKLKEPKIYDELKIFINNNLLSDLPFKQQVWHFVNNEPNNKKCPVCGDDVSFRDSITKGYHEFCSLSCANNSGMLGKRVSNRKIKKPKLIIKNEKGEVFINRVNLILNHQHRYK